MIVLNIYIKIHLKNYKYYKECSNGWEYKIPFETVTQFLLFITNYNWNHKLHLLNF